MTINLTQWDKNQLLTWHRALEVNRTVQQLQEAAALKSRDSTRRHSAPPTSQMSRMQPDVAHRVEVPGLIAVETQAMVLMVVEDAASMGQRHVAPTHLQTKTPQRGRSHTHARHSSSSYSL